MAYPVDLGNLAPAPNRQGGVLPQNQLAFLVSDKAADNDPVMSQLAKSMWQSGNTNDAIFQATGMMVNPVTNEVLRNVPDSNASINKEVYQKMNEPPGLLTRAMDYITGSQTPPMTVPLKDLYNNPDIYKSYPWMADIPVSAFAPDERTSYSGGRKLENRGEYNILDNKMRINPDLDPEQQIYNINHELTHGRQFKDTKQNLGGNQSSWWLFENDLTNRYQKALESGEISSDLSPQQLAQQQMSGYLSNRGIPNATIGPGIGYDFYQRLAGESEARMNEFLAQFSRAYPNEQINPALMEKAAFFGASNPYWQQIMMSDARTMPLDPTMGMNSNTGKMYQAPAEFLQPKKGMPDSGMGDLPRNDSSQNSVNLGNMGPNLTRDTGYNRDSSSRDTGSSNSMTRDNFTGSYGSPGGGRDSGSSNSNFGGGAFSSSYNAREKRGGRIG